MELRRRSLDLRLHDAIAGSVVMVTGASSGIGAATARAIAPTGATVLLVARSEERLRSVERDVVAAGGIAHVHRADLSDPVATHQLVTDVLDAHGRVDVLVSNAGRSIRRSVELAYERDHDYTRTIDVNYLGPVRLVLGFLPEMRRRGRGHIVNVSTLGVLFPAPRFSAYVASKSAFDAFLRCVGTEVRGDGVAVTGVYLPLVRTPMIEATTPYRTLPSLSAEEAARRVCTAIADRPATVAPRSARLTKAALDLAPSSFNWLTHLTYRASTDSAAARGEAASTTEAPTRLRSAGEWLARLFGGGRSAQ